MSEMAHTGVGSGPCRLRLLVLQPTPFCNIDCSYWLKVVNELKARGVNDILIAVVDGLKGFPEAITSVFPQTVVQTCIVHLIRNRLAFVSWKDRKAILPAIKAIYRAENADMALVRVEEFEAE